MRRRIFTLLSAGSLVLCVGIGSLLLWNLLSGGPGTIFTGRGHVAVEAEIYRSDFWLRAWWYRSERELFLRTQGDGWFLGELRESGIEGLGFRAGRWEAYEVACWYLKMPTWFALVVTAIPSAAWGFVWHKRRTRSKRREFGLCLQCAYDLRASEGKCPECGMAIPADLVRKPIA